MRDSVVDMDEYDEYEPDPEPHYFDARTNDDIDGILVKNHPPKQLPPTIVEDDPGFDVEADPFVPVRSPD